MITQRNQELLNYLSLERVFPRHAIEKLHDVSIKSIKKIEELIVDLGFAKDDELIAIVSKFGGYPALPEATSIEDVSIAQLLEEEYLRKLNAVPIEIKDGCLLLALADPRDDDTLKAISFHLNMKVVPYIANETTISNLLDDLYPPVDLQTGSAKDTDKEIIRLQAEANEGPIVSLVQDIIAKAVDGKASDIHIESQDGLTNIRFRVHGVLQHFRNLKHKEALAVFSRLKIMADLNISEVRRPQDGRIRTRLRGREIDLRLSTLPTQFGESAVLRVLDQTQVSLDWHSLGFQNDRVEELQSLLNLPNGVFLVSGPTGSGKTTTLYTALKHMDVKRLKTITIEDPIEYSLLDINQVQIHPEIGLTFASALRAILRQDPDVILIGEIRDQETAENAVRAALMGRLVLSTVHTNSAFGSLTRLIDLGIPRFLLAETLRGVLSQRLVRCYCAGCQGEGCKDCDKSGFSGRKVVSELLTINSKLKTEIATDTPIDLIEKMALETGYQTIREDADRLIKSNETSKTEVERVIG